MSFTEEFDSRENWFQEHVCQYDGALIDGDGGESWFYHMSDNSGEGSVVYITGSVGNVIEYTYEELHNAIQSEEVVLATNHKDEEYFETPDGPVEY